MKVETGSLWRDARGNFFRVISVIEKDGHTWVHYRRDTGVRISFLETTEFSCYQESFVERFFKAAE